MKILKTMNIESVFSKLTTVFILIVSSILLSPSDLNSQCMTFPLSGTFGTLECPTEDITCDPAGGADAIYCVSFPTAAGATAFAAANSSIGGWPITSTIPGGTPAFAVCYQSTVNGCNAKDVFAQEIGKICCIDYSYTVCPTCEGASTGSITVNASGSCTYFNPGGNPVTNPINSFTTTGSTSNLAVGNYSITVSAPNTAPAGYTNTSGCDVVIDFEITEDGEPMITCPMDGSAACGAASLSGTAEDRFVAFGGVIEEACGLTATYSDNFTHPGACGGDVLVDLVVTFDAPDPDPDIIINCQYTITVAEATLPIITCPVLPAITCEEVAAYVPPIAAYTNSLPSPCLLEGTVTGVVSAESFTECGGTITVTYSGMDACSRAMVAVDCVVTVTKAGAATIACPVIAPMSCEAAIAFVVPDATFTNALAEPCLNSGMVSGAITSTDYDACGGTFTITYSGVDACGDPLVPLECVVDVTEAILPVITCPVFADMTCVVAETFAPPLATYTNGSAAPCLLEGTVTGIITARNYDGCFGGTLTVTYTGTDACGRTMDPVMCVANVLPAPPVASFACPEFPATLSCEGANSFVTPPVVSFTNGLTGLCLVNLTAVPTVVKDVSCGGSIEITYVITSPCGIFPDEVCTIDVVDEVKPVIMNAPSDLYVECASALLATDVATWLADFGGMVAVDDCGDVALSVAGPVISTLCGATEVREYIFTATDECGNSIDEVAYVHIVDTTAPELLAAVVPGMGACLNGNPDPIADAWAATIAPFVDDCGVVTTSYELLNFTATCANGVAGLYTYEFKGVDECGNIAITTGTFTVTDGTVPVLVAPDDITIECGPNAAGIIEAWENGAVIIDGCDGTLIPTFTSEFAAECGDSGVWTYTFDGMDACNNSAVDEIKTVTILDTQKPVIMLAPSNLYIECDGAGNAGDILAWTDIFGGMTAVDNCGVPVLSFVAGAPIPLCGLTQVIPYTFTATDPCGNFISEVAYVHIVDTTIPVALAIAPGAGECVNGNPDVLADTWAAGIAAGIPFEDDCSTMTVDYELINFIPDCGITGEYIYEFEATDECGNIATTMGSFILSDLTPPVLTAPDDITIECGPNAAGIIEAWENGALLIDACDNTLAPTFAPVFAATCGDAGVWTYTFSGVDACGNPATDIIKTVTILDTQKPVIMLAPSDLYVECDGAGNAGDILAWTDAFGGMTAIDNCGDPVLSFVAGAPNLLCGGTQVIPYTFTATDPCGNFISEVAYVHIVDTTIPVATAIVPGTGECINGNPDVLADTWAAGIAAAIPFTDDCSEMTVDYELISFIPNCGVAGEYIYEFEATDECGNIATTMASYVVTDITAPVLTVPDNITIECGPDAAGIIEAWENDALLIDACDNTLQPTFVSAFVAACGESGVWTYTFSGVDACGNAAADLIRTVTILDTQKPVIMLAPSNLYVECDGAGNVADIAAWELAFADMTAVDNCGDPVLSLLAGTPIDFCEGEQRIPYTFTATDPCGNFISEVATVVIYDATPPAFTGIVPGSAICVNGNPDVLAENWAGGIAASVPFTDICSTVTVDYELISHVMNCGVTGVYTYEFRGTDNCYNQTIATSTFTVTDGTIPVLITPDDITIECGPDAAGIIEAWENGALLVDGCDNTLIPTFTSVFAGTCGDAGVWTYTYAGVDECGNAADDVIRTVTILDTQKPVIMVPPADLYVECDGAGNVGDILAWTDIFGGMTGVDNCGVPVLSFVAGIPVALCGGTQVIPYTFTATDPCGNLISEIAYVYIEDTTSPTIAVVDNAPVECSDINGYDFADTWAASQAIPANAADDCSDVNVDYELISFVPTCNDAAGVYTYEFKATDACGNSAVTTATYTIVDKTIPVLVVPDNIIVECNANSAAIIEAWENTAEAIDECQGSVPVTFLTAAVPACGNTEVITYTFSTTDGCNPTSMIRTVTITDTQKPVIMLAPSDLYVECDGAGNAADILAWTDTFGGMTAVDNCGDPVLSFVTGIPVALCGGTQVIPYTFTATDPCGNLISEVAYVHIEDTTSPSIAVVDNAPVECSDINGYDFADTWAASQAIPANAADDCSDVTVDYELISFVPSCNNAAGVYTYEFKATDACGNTAITTATYTIVDTTIPVLVVPDNIILECDANNAAIIESWENTAEAIDACQGSVLVTFASASVPGCGNTEVITYTFSTTDGCNPTSMIRTVTIVDTKKPIALCKNIQLTLTPDNCGAGITILPADLDNGSYDICTADADLILSISKDNFTCADVGYNMVVLSVEDECGNIGTCMANVLVIDEAVNTDNVMLMVCPIVAEQDSGIFTLEEAEDAAATSNGSGVVINPDGGLVTYHISYNDADAGINPLASPFTSQTKTIYARVYGAAGCEDCFKVQELWLIVADSPDPDPQPWYEFCFKDLPAGAPVDGNPVGGTPPYITHIWAGPDVAILDDPTAAIPNVLPGTEPGLYKVTYQVIDSKGCISEEYTYIKILIHEPLGIMACTSTPVICEGKKIRLEADVMVGMEGVPPYTWAWEETASGWTSTDQNPMIRPSDVGYPLPVGTFTYSVTVTDDNDCTSTTTVEVVVNDTPAPIDPMDVVNTYYCPTSKATGNSPIKGTPINSSVLSVDCGATACDGFLYGGGPICDDLPAPTATATWYDVATGGTALFDADFDGDGVLDDDLDGDPSTFDPVAAGLVDPWDPGVYTFYVSCSCVPCDECTTDRVPVTLTILDCNAGPEECTYLVVLKDTGANGWDGAFLNISVDEGPAVPYKISTEECDMKIIPITTAEGGIVDFDYCNGANEEEHFWCVLDVFGNIVLDVNGSPMEYGPNPAVHDDVRMKLDCPDKCEEEAAYKIVITMGDSPMDQSWELYNAKDSIIAWAGPGDYMGLAPGTILVDTTITLSSCDDLKFIAYDGTGNGWASGCWSIQGTDSDRGTVVLDSEGQPTGCYEIAGGCGGWTFENQSRFTIPCKPVDCPSTMTVFANDVANCQLTGWTPPFSPTPFVCYPNCGHASPAPVVTNNLGDPIPVGANELIYTITYADGQVVRCTSVVNVITTANPTMVCNDNVNFSLLQPGVNGVEDCYTLVSPDDVLEATEGCPGQYEIHVFDENGNDLGNMVGPEHAGSTLTYEIHHIGSGTKCWGTVTIEDKNAPIISCMDYEIACTHPEAMNEEYCHDIVFNANGGSVPKNIAGNLGSDAFVQATLDCGPLGEIVKTINIDVTHTHSRPTDLSLLITAPNGSSVVTPIPVDQMLIDAWLNAFVKDLEGVWDFDFTDNNGMIVDNGDVGKGKIKNVTVTINAGFPKLNTVVDCTYDGELVLVKEELIETNCDQSDWLGAKIERTWQAIDRFGNSSTCVQTIGLVAPSIDDIEFPGDIDLECGTVPSDPELLTPEYSGGFNFDCFDLTNAQHSACDILITYTDHVLPTCGEGYKIVRDFTILNCCTNTAKYHTQTIKVEDSEGPVIVIGDIQMMTSPTNCSTGSVGLTPAVTDACSGVSSIVVEYTAGGGAYGAGGSTNIVDVTNGDNIPDLPFGITELMITATDNCFNTTVELIQVNVTDSSTPVAICDDQLNVVLNNNGTAVILASDLDEGSSDNCGIATIEIRKINPNCVPDTTAWAPYVIVGCCDVGESTILELKVTDVTGNTNVCWSTILVEDGVAPIIDCQPDITVDCNDPILNTVFVDPIATDDCGNPSVTLVESGELDNCGAGTLIRTYTASDGSDKSADATCTQRITVEHVSDFTVQFPPDVTIDTCPGDNLGDTGAPIILDDDCELVAINSEDQLLSLTDDNACYKILRTWTLINWCTYDDSQTPTDGGIPLPLPNTFRDDDGYFKYVQTIKVLDEVAPTVDMPTPDPCDFTDACEGFVELIAVGSDDCSTELEYNYTIDAFSDGTIDITGDGEDASAVYPYGCHTITWNVGDKCGNWTTADFEFCVEDCKNPTPVCLHGISVEVMNDGDGCVPIWAEDLLEYAFDNCDEEESVEASVLIRRCGDTGPPQTSIEVCCDDISAGQVCVEVWVTDEAGNSDYCETYIIPQDNLGNCPSGGSGSSELMIAGNVETECNGMVENVEVEISSTVMTAMYPTKDDGHYEFPNLANGNTYTITPKKDDFVLNGVSTYDLVLISQHILFITPLNSPYQMIAADVNGSGTITTFDLVQLRKLILFVIDDFPTNASWRFVDKDFVFPDPSNPWSTPFPESISYSGMINDQMLSDFVGIKIGDVNCTNNPNRLQSGSKGRTGSTLQFKIEDIEMVAGEEYSIDFLAKDFNELIGFQGTMKFDEDVIEFLGTKAGALKTTDYNFGTMMLDEGIVTMSYSDAEIMEEEDGQILFSLKVKAKEDALLSDVFKLIDRYTPVEAYNAEGEIIDLALTFDVGESIAKVDQFELLQNKPNPFHTYTVIGFTLPKTQNATLTIFDVSGRMLKVIDDEFTKGYNEIRISREELKSTGVLYYQLDSATDSANKKMIILD